VAHFLNTDINKKCCRCGEGASIFEDGHCYCISCYGIIHPLDVELKNVKGG
jgi:hypothetical protein